MLSDRVLNSARWCLVLCILGTIGLDASGATISGLSQLGGWVYIDRNNDGNLAFSNDPNPEFVIGGVAISLFSTTASVDTFVTTTQSDDFGRYLFENINPGAYKLEETQPIEYVDGIDTLGTLESLNNQPIPGNASIGAMTNNTFSNIVLTADVGGDFYNFGERGLAAGYVSKRLLFGTRPPPNTPPLLPPGGGPPGGPVSPEPTSIVTALYAVCGGWLALRRHRRV